MARENLRLSPRGNPCAQCGKPISSPDWVEQQGADRVSYLWTCRACNYRFEAVAFFDEREARPEPLAA
jgi:ribosomal protein L37AE/L43A